MSAMVVFFEGMVMFIVICEWCVLAAGEQQGPRRGLMKKPVPRNSSLP